MRRLTTFRVVLLSLALGVVAACLLYKQAWRMPFYQNYRDARLFFALWITAVPLAALACALGRIAAWRAAMKGAAICLGIAVPTYGLTANFDKIRNASRDQAVLCNIRQLSAAADQYFLENGVTVIPRYEELVGRDKYIKALNPVAGEDYRVNFPFRQGGVLSADFPSGRIMNYYTDSQPPGYKNIFEPGEIPPWRVHAPVAPKTGGTLAPATATSVATSASAPALSDEALKRELGTPTHKVRRGTMCASCHAKKT